MTNPLDTLYVLKSWIITNLKNWALELIVKEITKPGDLLQLHMKDYLRYMIVAFAQNHSDLLPLVQKNYLDDIWDDATKILESPRLHKDIIKK